MHETISEAESVHRKRRSPETMEHKSRRDFRAILRLQTADCWNAVFLEYHHVI